MSFRVKCDSKQEYIRDKMGGGGNKEGPEYLPRDDKQIFLIEDMPMEANQVVVSLRRITFGGACPQVQLGENLFTQPLKINKKSSTSKMNKLYDGDV